MDFLSRYRRLLIRLALIVAGVICFLFLFSRLVAPPDDFPAPYHLSVNRGQTLLSLSQELVDAHAIRSPRLFEIFIITFGSEKNLSEGEYYFDRPVTSFELALRIAGREFGVTREKITFPEGFTNKQIAARLAQALDNFDSSLFLTLAKDEEGYLFPDTYRFFPTATPDFVLAVLRQSFDRKIDPLRADIRASGRSERDIVIMASLIEKEAAGDNDRAMISGILWKRLDQGLPLQVDAPFLYVLGKESKELTKTDLAINSPYNTYRFKGLPPTPIGNPGLAAITAAIHPTPSPYLYYLHDKDGGIHYAKTYTEHRQNVLRYLD